MRNTKWSDQDHAFMAEALRLAERGLYTSEPNPRVGCVLVSNGEVVGRGWHQTAGKAHAEVNAIADAGSFARGACAYVTLEPCSHQGKTPPCVNALIEAGVTRVVGAMVDPNPLVSGKGYALLEEAGIAVQWGLLEEQSRALNPGFIKRMSAQRPYVRLKVAMSLDGRTAMASGESQWITGEPARADVQKLRARSSAVLTGLGTVKLDDPGLILREGELHTEYADLAIARQPLRVVLDPQTKLSGQEKLFHLPGRCVYFAGKGAALPRQITDNDSVLVQAMDLDHAQHFDLDQVLCTLAEQGCNEVLVEAGASLLGAFVAQNCWDELVVYMAPKLMGSKARPLLVLPFEEMSDSVALCLAETVMVGDDLRLRYVNRSAKNIGEK